MAERPEFGHARAAVAHLVVSPGLVLPDQELSWVAVRSSGPGGQNVNKVSTKVELRFDVVQSAVLSDGVKSRLLASAGKRIDATGCLILTCDVTRSQTQNLELVRSKLAAMVLSALTPPRKRRPTRPTKASNQRRLTQKSMTSQKKADRRGGD